jgi:hypothetical protein
MLDLKNFPMAFASFKIQNTKELDATIQKTSNFSNRCKKCQTQVFPLATITPGGLAGVDKVKIGLGISPGTGTWREFLDHLNGSPMGVTAQGVTVYHPVTKAALYFKFYVNKNKCDLYVEFNPSRFSDPTGYSLIHPEKVSEVVEEIIREYLSSGIIIPSFAAGRYSMENWHPDWKQMIRISRLDIARDMLISDPEFSPFLLKAIQSKFSRGTNLAFNDGNSNGWGSFLKGVDGRMNIYNKFEQAKKVGLNPLPPKCFYRFEYRLGPRHLNSNHLHSLGDLSEDRFEAALRIGWDKSRLSTPFLKPYSWVDIVEDSALAPNEKSEIIGYLIQEARGLDLAYSIQADREIRSKIRSIGISFRKDLNSQGLSTFQLDLDLGDLLISNLVKRPP